MSKACKRLSRLLCLVWACACLADDAVSPPACSDGVCVVNVFSAALLAPPCTDETVLVAYSQSTGATLIQCSDPSDPEENKAFVYDRHNAAAKAHEFRGGRFIRPDYLPTAVSEGIPDKFGVVPLCAAKERRAATAGELLLAMKQPNASKDAPYCYHIHYVVAGKETLQIVGDDGQEQPASTPSEIAAWAKLRQNLSPYLDAGSASKAPPNQARVAVVSSDKARLFQSPDAASSSKMYLVRGDQVELVDDRNSGAGWWRVRYVSKSGRAIEAWMRAGDLDLPQ